jgi:hypothetical protein
LKLVSYVETVAKVEQLEKVEIQAEVEECPMQVEFDEVQEIEE